MTSSDEYINLRERYKRLLIDYREAEKEFEDFKLSRNQRNHNKTFEEISLLTLSCSNAQESQLFEEE